MKSISDNSQLKHRIAWLPAHPAMGWTSMNHYWHALTQAQSEQPNVSCYSLLKLSAIEQPAVARWKRVLIRNIIYPLQVRKLRANVVHLLDHSFADLLRHVRPNTKIIANVYDLIPLMDSSGLSSGQLERFRKRVSLLKLADKIITCSEFTAKCVQRFLPEISIDKITVIPLGVRLPEKRTFAVDHLAKNDRPSILSVGSTLARKNLALLPAVLQQLKTVGIDAKLIRVGQKLPESLAQQIASIIGVDQLHELGFVSDTELRDHYASSTLTFFPSRLEGFGLPVLEAMAHGCPVVCADSSSIPEVAGVAARLFSPDDSVAAAKHMIQIIQHPDQRALMVKAGLERASSLTWKHHWSALQPHYQSLLHPEKS